MVLAYHVISGMYGFWLPNDERGSWSDFVGCWELLSFGKATTVGVRQSLAKQPFDRAKRDAARAALKHPPVVIDGVQARAIARGFAEYAASADIRIHACTILPQHVHLVVGRSRLRIEPIVIQLKGAATRQLNADGIHPLRAHAKQGSRTPKAFARGEWKVFLDRPRDIRRAIGYVEDNPLREHLARQRWPFVVPY